MTRVSVVIPCYNDGTHLREAVESALEQDHDDIEVIVVDDGSDDQLTLDVLRVLPQLGARVLKGTHAGVSTARNTAIEAATGQYVLPLDADDRLARDFAGAASGTLDADPTVGIVGAGTEFFGSDSGVVHPDLPHPTSWLAANQLPVSAMFRRDDWRVSGGYPEDLRWGEDWYFWVKLVALGRRVSILPDVGLFYRRRPGQVTSHVPWDIQENTRARVLEAGLPILNEYPREGSKLLAADLNQLRAMRERRSERARNKVLGLVRRH